MNVELSLRLVITCVVSFLCCAPPLLYYCAGEVCDSDGSLGSKSKMLSSISAIVNLRIAINLLRSAARDSGEVVGGAGTERA